MRLLAVLVCLAAPAAAQPLVVADIAPVQSLVAEVMGNTGTPELLVRGDPHELQLRPSQARALQRADLIVWVGAALTPGLAAPIAAAPGIKLTFDQPGTGLTLRSPSFGTGTDPHLWLDPQNGRTMLTAIAQTLEKADPDHAAAYAANAKAAEVQLNQTIARTEATLKPAAGKRVIVSHDALEYFAARYGLTVAGALTDPNHTTPSAARLAELHQKIADGGADCILGIAGESERAAERLAADTGLPYARIDPVASALPPGPNLYPRLLETLAAAVAACTATPG